MSKIGNREVLNQLMELKSTTAKGHDEIPAFVLKKVAAAITPNISLLINSCIVQGKVPLEWKKANIAAIWKNKGSKKDPSNYRPISVLLVLARVMEKLVAKQLTNYCDLKHIIPKEQFGFRAKSSCEIALITAVDH